MIESNDKNQIEVTATDITGVTLDSVKGYAEEKEEIKKFINLLHNFQQYKDKGIYIPRGLILQGPPGCGKTLLAKAIANGCGLPFYNFQADSSGERTLTKIIDTFKVAKKSAPAIIYIDEIDKLVGRRYFSSDIVRSLTQYLLTELDGLNTGEGLMLIASTNDYHEIPEALLRSGRMDKRIKIGYPDVESRAEILSYYMKPHRQFDKININSLAVKVEGLTGADIKTLVNNTLIDCIDKKEYIDDDDFLRSVTELNFEDIGRRWKNNRAREDTIIHECGHSVVSYVLTGNHGAINCLKYGNSAGHTSFTEIPGDEEEYPEEEEIDRESEFLSTVKESYKRIDSKLIKNTICVCLGGMVAERVFFGDHLAGCSSDIAAVDRLLNRLIDGLWAGPKNMYLRGRANKYKARVLKDSLKRTMKVIKSNVGLIKFLAEEVKEHFDVMSYEQLDEAYKKYHGV